MTPEGWKRGRLDQILSLEYGKPLPDQARLGGPFPVVGSNGTVGQHNEALVEFPGVVVGRKGSAGAIRWVDRPFWPIDTTYFVRPAGSALDHRWIFFALQTLGLERLASLGGVPGLNRNDAYEQIVCVPPLPE